MTNFEENGMFEEEKEARTYCAIKEAKIAIKSSKEDKKAQAIKYLNDDDEECFSYYRMYSKITGKLVDIRTRDGKFQKELCITLTNDKGDLVELQMGLYTSYARDFMKRLPSTNLNEEVVINPFKIKQEKSEFFNHFCLIKQKNEQGKLVSCKSHYTKDEPNGLPAWEKTKVKGKESWNQDKQTEFLEEMVSNDVLPVIKGNAVAEEAYVENLEGEEGNFEQEDEEIEFTTDPDDLEPGI
jgi:hypothetical protein